MPQETKMEGAVETATAAVEKEFMNGGTQETPADGNDETAADLKPVTGIKRALIWAALILGSWALVIGIGYAAYKVLHHDGPAATYQASVITEADGTTTVTVPAVRGVNAVNCRPDELVVVGNRLVFKNGCAKPVFYDQEK